MRISKTPAQCAILSLSQGRGISFIAAEYSTLPQGVYPNSELLSPG
jgi:hypothetical protein